jgi:hypothetical protein
MEKNWVFQVGMFYFILYHMESNCLGIWCLNPAAGFRYVSENARSVILTSGRHYLSNFRPFIFFSFSILGTLAPFDSFLKELGVRFHHVMEADHVIRPHQLRANVISRDKEKVYKVTHNTADSSSMQGTCRFRCLIKIANVVLFVYAFNCSC